MRYWLAKFQQSLATLRSSIESPLTGRISPDGHQPKRRTPKTNDPAGKSSRKERAQRLGKRGEQAAAKFLKQLGYRILAEGHLQRLGEIDLIALDGECLVFVEVKTWMAGSDALPADAVDLRKQEKLTRAALIYLKQHRLLDRAARFDVISIIWPSSAKEQPDIRHFKHAFEAVGRFQMFR